MALFVDITDLYYKLLKKFGSGKLDYSKYFEEVRTLAASGPTIAYGCQENNEASSFIKYLRSLSFITKYKRPYVLKIGDRDIKRCSWLVGIAVDVFQSVENGDNNIVLGISNPDIIPLVKYLKERGISVTIFACSIPASLQRLTTCVEITEDLLEGKSVLENKEND